jgi:hypothetical protein
VRASLNAIRAKPEMAGSVSFATAPFTGQLYWLATRQDGTITRLDAEGGSAPISGIDLAEAAKRIAGDVEIAEQALMSGGDAYYFQESERFVLASAGTGAQTRSGTRARTPVKGFLMSLLSNIMVHPRKADPVQRRAL